MQMIPWYLQAGGRVCFFLLGILWRMWSDTPEIDGEKGNYRCIHRREGASGREDRLEGGKERKTRERERTLSNVSNAAQVSSKTCLTCTEVLGRQEHRWGPRAHALHQVARLVLWPLHLLHLDSWYILFTVIKPSNERRLKEKLMKIPYISRP